MAARAPASAPQSAAALPPPGAGLSVESWSAKPASDSCRKPGRARIADPVLDDLLFRHEGPQLVEPQRAHRDVHQFALGDGGGTALLLQVVPPRGQDRLARDESHEFAAGHPQASLLRLAAGGVEDRVHRARPWCS